MIKVKAIKDWEPLNPSPKFVTILPWQNYDALGNYLCKDVFGCEPFNDRKMKIYVRLSDSDEEFELDKFDLVKEKVKPQSLIILRKSDNPKNPPAAFKPTVMPASIKLPTPKEEAKPIDTTPKPISKPIDETPKPISKPIHETPKPISKPIDETPKDKAEETKPIKHDQDTEDSHFYDKNETDENPVTSPIPIHSTTNDDLTEEKANEQDTDTDTDSYYNQDSNIDDKPVKSDLSVDKGMEINPSKADTNDEVKITEEPMENQSDADDEVKVKIDEDNFNADDGVPEKIVEDPSKHASDEVSSSLTPDTSQNDVPRLSHYASDISAESSELSNETKAQLSHSTDSSQVSTFSQFSPYLSPSPSADIGSSRPRKLSSIVATDPSTPGVARPSSLIIRQASEFELRSLLRMNPTATRLAHDITNNFSVVYKEFESFDVNELKQDLENWASLTSPSVMPLLGFVEAGLDDDNCAIILPFESKGSLENVIQLENLGQANSSWDYTQKCIVTYGIVQAMCELHSKNIVHGNLSPKSIFLSDSYEPLLSDICIKQFFDNTQTTKTAALDSMEYTAPEMIFDNNESIRNDVYSFAMVLYFIWMKNSPYAKQKLSELWKNLENCNRPFIPKCMKSNVTDLIEQCWVQDPDSRPSFEQISEIISKPDFFKSKQYKFDGSRFMKYQSTIKGNISLNESMSMSSSNELILNNSMSKLDLLLSMAKDGNADAQYQYACMLRDGEGAEEDPVTAARYFKLSASQSYEKAMIEYAVCIKEGYGVEKDEVDAFMRLSNVAVQHNNMDAQYLLGRWYESSNPHKYALAYKYYKMASDSGHSDAPAAIGSLLLKKKLGSTASMREIIDLYQKAANASSNEGRYYLATLYHYGYPPYLKKDLKQASKLYMLSSQEESEVQEQAAFSLTILHQETGDFKQAFEKSEYYMNRSMFVGYLRCAELYEGGIGVRRNTIKAKQIKAQASKPKYARDQCRIACLYSRGTGCPKNKEKAFQLTELAANNGDIPAMVNLANYYLSGNGVEKDLDKAKKWADQASNLNSAKGKQTLALIYKKKFNNKKLEKQFLKEAAELGLPSAMTELAIHYRHRRKYLQAEKWFKAAVENNEPIACFYYGKELFEGKHYTQDIEQGYKLMEDASFMGNLHAIDEIISILENGINGIPKDISKLKKLQDLKREAMK